MGATLGVNGNVNSSYACTSNSCKDFATAKTCVKPTYYTHVVTADSFMNKTSLSGDMFEHNTVHILVNSGTIMGGVGVTLLNNLLMRVIKMLKSIIRGCRWESAWAAMRGLRVVQYVNGP